MKTHGMLASSPGETAAADRKRRADGSGGGGSRAAQRRAKKKAKAQDGTTPTASLDDSQQPAPMSGGCGSTGLQPKGVACSSSASEVEAAAVVAEGSVGKYREWRIPMPEPGAELHDALLVALAQAQAIHGRKYRYGAILLSGEDHIPLRSGSNKTPFQRDKIHAEMSALKGYPRPEGKDMLIGRLAPVRPPGRTQACTTTSGAHVCSDGDDESSDDEWQRFRTGSKTALQNDGIHRGGCSSGSGSGSSGGGADSSGNSSATAATGFGGKILNARPCERCKAAAHMSGTSLPSRVHPHDHVTLTLAHNLALTLTLSLALTIAFILALTLARTSLSPFHSHPYPHLVLTLTHTSLSPSRSASPSKSPSSSLAPLPAPQPSTLT